MGQKRAERIWEGAGGDTQRRGKADESPWKKKSIEECWIEAERLDGIREACQYDYLYLYNNFLAERVRDRKTGVIKMQTLGFLHLLLMDFLSIELHGSCATYTDLPSWLPAKDENGDFTERWLYFRTLDAPPQIQDGPHGPISDMFYGGAKIWQGVVIRICGDGFTKCVLAPRGHLKSTVGGFNRVLWLTCRHPEERHVVRSVTSQLAKDFLDGVKYPYDQNQAFIDVFGHRHPAKREAAWNTEMIQLMCADRRGINKTVASMGMESEGTGTHGDCYLNDDVVGESNTLTAQLRSKARHIIEKQQAQRDMSSNLTDIGTRWEEDDAHIMFVGKPGESAHSGSLAKYTSFFVATVLDGDESHNVSTHLSPLGYGKPIWPEHWTMQTIEEKRAGMPDDRFWCGQYFNQFAGTTNRLFKKEWIKRFELKPGQSLLNFAREHKLNITIGADTGSGLPSASERAKRDDTGILVGGQTQDRRTNYVLDGLREKLPVELLAKGLLDLSEKWYENTKSYGGSFRVGFEKTKWVKILGPVLAEEQRRRGIESTFPIELLSHESAPKVERIRVLVVPYSDGRILWPETLFVPSLLGREPYDLCQCLEGEFTGYNPYATEDNLLDAHAYQYKIAFPTEWNEKPVDEAKEKRDKFAREMNEERELAMAGVNHDGPDNGGYNAEQMERPY